MNGYNLSSVLRVGGMFTVAFSVVAGLLITFVIPNACSIVGELQLVSLGFLNIIGLGAFITGLVLSRRERSRQQAI